MTNPWVAFGLALAVAVALILTGNWSSHAMLALIVLLLVAGMFPPLGIAVFSLVLVTLLLRHPGVFSNNLADAANKIKAGFTTKPQ